MPLHLEERAREVELRDLAGDLGRYLAAPELVRRPRMGGSLPRASAIWKFSAATVLRDSCPLRPRPPRTVAGCGRPGSAGHRSVAASRGRPGSPGCSPRPRGGGPTTTSASASPANHWPDMPRARKAINAKPAPATISQTTSAPERITSAAAGSAAAGGSDSFNATSTAMRGSLRSMSLFSATHTNGIASNTAAATRIARRWPLPRPRVRAGRRGPSLAAGPGRPARSRSAASLCPRLNSGIRVAIWTNGGTPKITASSSAPDPAIQTVRARAQHRALPRRASAAGRLCTRNARTGTGSERSRVASAPVVVQEEADQVGGSRCWSTPVPERSARSADRAATRRTAPA